MTSLRKAARYLFPGKRAKFLSGTLPDVVDIRECFPVVDYGNGAILSRWGELSLALSLSMGEAFTLDREGYSRCHSALTDAIRSLPEGYTLQKLDLMRGERFSLPSPQKEESFLEKSFRNHFEGREYLTARSYLIITSGKNSTYRTTGLGGISPKGKLPSESALSSLSESVERFSSILSREGSSVSVRLLSSDEIFGSGSRPGIIGEYLSLLGNGPEGKEELSDISLFPDRIVCGERSAKIYAVSDLSLLPPFLSPSRESPFSFGGDHPLDLSLMHPLTRGLSCDHMLSVTLRLEGNGRIVSGLESKRKRMSALSGKSSSNRVASLSIGEHLDSLSKDGGMLVRCHVSLFMIEKGDRKKADAPAALSSIGFTPCGCRLDCPSEFWGSVPGNAVSVPPESLMTMDLEPAVCLLMTDAEERGICEERNAPSSGLRLCGRMDGIPHVVDFWEKAMDKGLVHNCNAFVLGPSGSGKSFFMNALLHSSYREGHHCFILDVGGSYRSLCSLISEESGGRDGAYYSFEWKGDEPPLLFAPLRGLSKAGDLRKRKETFAPLSLAILKTIWEMTEHESVPYSDTEMREGIDFFLESWDNEKDPNFDDLTRSLEQWNSARLHEGLTAVDLSGLFTALTPFHMGKEYGLLLNSWREDSLTDQRFAVFDLDPIKDDPVRYPLSVLIIMDAFSRKMKSCPDFKVMVIEEAWKALSSSSMGFYVLELYKTARKWRTGAVTVSQELSDITSGGSAGNTILENSDTRILLDQSRFGGRMDELSRALSLSDHDSSLVLSMGKGPLREGRDVFISAGSAPGKVLTLEVSAEERICFSSSPPVRKALSSLMEEEGSAIKAIEGLSSSSSVQ